MQDVQFRSRGLLSIEILTQVAEYFDAGELHWKILGGGLFALIGEAVPDTPDALQLLLAALLLKLDLVDILLLHF